MSTGILGGLTFVLVFAGIILVHEFGHFVAARLLKIEVDEFGIGFPPRMLTLFTWRGTRFTLNWIPLGGFVRPKGEDNPDIPGGLAASPAWKRVLVLVAGATMNLLTAVIIFAILYAQIGVPDRVSIEEVDPDSPAAAASMQPGDVILLVDDQEIHSITEVQAYTTEHAGEQIAVTLLRGEEQVVVTLVPRLDPPPGQGRMGILTRTDYRPMKSIFETVGYSLQATGEAVGQILSLPGRLIAGTLSTDEAAIGGPRSIWNLFQQSVERDVESRQPEGPADPAMPTYYTLSIIISLTITVAVFNLLPFPALDGGRIFFALIELIFRWRVSPRFETALHGIGFLIAIAVMGYFYIADFIDPVTINLP
ncbi:MAG: site-2 protease family protein [Anaerolineales bacterium]|nr:site-2 protease family protein [Anaerolineales bacterium]